MASTVGPHRDSGRAELGLSAYHHRIYRTGDEYFPALIEAIRLARERICFEVYIFRSDATGRSVSAALCDAAKRGVRVRLLLDAWGSSSLDAKLAKQMTDAGIQLLCFQPLGRWFRAFKKNVLRRLHRKVVVIDGKLAFVGGINVSDEQTTRAATPGLFDYAVSVAGPIVHQIETSSRILWKFVRAGGPYPKSLAMHRIWPPRRVPIEGMEFVTRDNLRNRSAIEERYLHAINQAQSEILIANAYFFPSRRFRRALRRAARRGVRVRLILQGMVDVILIRYATKALYRQLLQSGIGIFEDYGAVVHAKVAVFDGRLYTIGSSNLDPISLGLNLEANLFIEDENGATLLRRQLERELDRYCCEINIVSLDAQPWYMRLFSWICFGVVRFLSRLVRSQSTQA